MLEKHIFYVDSVVYIKLDWQFQVLPNLTNRSGHFDHNLLYCFILNLQNNIVLHDIVTVLYYTI